MAWRLITGQADTPLCEWGWKSLGVLELTALPSIDDAHWVPMVQETDVLLVGGGDVLYLSHWMRQSGLATLLQSQSDTVYVGVSAGSLVLTPHVGEEFVGWRPPSVGDRTLGLLDFAVFPHLDDKDLPEHSLFHAEKWATGMSVPGYAIDAQTAITVVGGSVEVVSEGHWKLFAPQTQGGGLSH